MKGELESMRQRIDAIDDKLVRLLAERMEVAVRLGRLKLAVMDRGREQAVLEHIRRLSGDLLRPEFSERLYGEIFLESRRLQEERLKLIGFQGEHGAYSELAARSYDSSLIPIPCTQFADVFEGVEKGRLDLGIVPMENSLEGSVTQASDLLREKSLKIVAAIRLPVHHCLLTLPETEGEEIRVVFSHPQASGQCSRFTSKKGLEVRPFYDTAGAARMLAAGRLPSAGVIAGRLCAELYGLKVVAEDIEDHPSNRTRFAVLSREATETPGDKCSVICSARHEAGTLFRMLRVFSDRGINLTRIESRPMRDDPERYSFLVDFEGSRNDKVVEEAMGALQESTDSVRLLGCYKEVEA